MVFAINKPIASTTFRRWVEQFAGDVRPTEDLAEYLSEGFGVEITSLEEDVSEADDMMRTTAKELWISVHESRRTRIADWDPHLTLRLAEHDTENYVGILGRRTRETGKAQLGYKAWWLTIDSAAWEIARELHRLGLEGHVGHPILSPDFLVNYLALGPDRSRLSRSSDEALPLILGRMVTDVPDELMELVEKIRNDHSDLPERILRRRVRDAIVRAKQHMGQIAGGGINAMQERFGL